MPLLISVLYTTISVKYPSFFVFDFDKEQVKALTKFGFTFLFYGLFLISLDLIDRFFLRFYQGDDIVGIYSACYRIGVAMNLVISGFRTAWIPFFLKLILTELPDSVCMSSSILMSVITGFGGSSLRFQEVPFI